MTTSTFLIIWLVLSAVLSVAFGFFAQAGSGERR